MAVVAAVLFGGLLLLAGVSVYSALMISKRTDEMVSRTEDDDETSSPLVVRFPDSVFRASGPER
ncbi:MAG: hypothetical protein ABFD49_04030 [Armatimonadota bacterium]|nr:hypothetical protein [bacterium]